MAGIAEVYRSPHLADCDERAFVLLAVGLPSAIGADPEFYRVYVDEHYAAEARVQLTRYEAEQRQEALRRAAAFAVPRPPRHPHAVLGAVLYGAVIVGVGLTLAAGYGPLNAFWHGDLHGERVQQGEWWRAITALTLHTDAPHLLANLAAGIWFGVLAGRQLGPGVAWLLILLAAATSNLLESLFGPPGHRAVGASTAVFAALGVLSANAWRAPFPRAQRWAVRWGPLVVGVILLGWFGSEGERTDVVAHIGGFLLGVVAGGIAARPAAVSALERVPQWAAGLA
ncbi:MAG: rhomboid family intramembrane serine protease, partial [Longimicrobiales bacterium]